jgi:hypothetical protein
MNGDPAAQVWQCKGTLAIPTVGSPDQLEQRFILRDRQELTLTEHPSGGRKVTREHPYLSDVRLRHDPLL